MGRKKEFSQFRTAKERDKWKADWDYWRKIVKEKTKGRTIILVVEEGDKR